MQYLLVLLRRAIDGKLLFGIWDLDEPPDINKILTQYFKVCLVKLITSLFGSYIFNNETIF